MKYPLVSIITPCYNGEEFVGRFLDSVLAQTYTNIELIIINDGSTDKTEEIILSYQEKMEDRGIQLIYLYEENKGQAAALNLGLKIFNGSYLTWPDSDDTLMRQSIEKKVNFLEKNKDYGMVRTNALIYNEKLNKTIRLSDSKYRFNEYIFEDLFLEKTFVSCGCYMIKADLFYQCYPKRVIFESREGQNYQMLLPTSSKSKCGFIDENLYCIVAREDSHSRITKTFDQHLKRLKNLRIILDEVFDISNCNKIDSKLKADIYYAQKKLELSYRFHNKECFYKEYSFLKQNNQLDTKNFLLNLGIKCKFIKFLLKISKMIIKKLKGIK